MIGRPLNHRENAILTFALLTVAGLCCYALLQVFHGARVLIAQVFP